MTGVPPTPRASRGDASRGAGRLAHLRRLGLLGALLAAGLGIAAPGPASAVTDDDCSAPTTVSWVYFTEDEEADPVPLDDPTQLPDDIATVEVDGESVPLVIRVERG